MLNVLLHSTFKNYKTCQEMSSNLKFSENIVRIVNWKFDDE